jgi:virulence factor Mce-like protein
MRRPRVISGSLLAVVAAAVLAFALTAAAGDEEEARGYKLQLDNAFGLTEGAELRVAGVKAGSVDRIRLDERRMLAEVEVRVTDRGFGDLRRDVFCQTRPQSLIGEYFVDCQPGRSPRRLPAGSTIPVRQTAAVVPPDLIQNIMRRPYRERFSILISELGGALAGRGEELNETIRRANPALREVNRVLRVLARQRTTIRELYRNADTVLAAVARRRRDVTRFVEEARDTTRSYARRAGDVDRQLRLLPPFLDELRPTLAALEGTAEQQRPAFASLRVAAQPLATLLRTSASFATASAPSVRSLAALGRRGRRSVEVALPNLRRLSNAVQPLPETAQNLGIILDHVDDPAFAAEPDSRAPRRNGGFTGLEAFLRFAYTQSQVTNVFDEDSHLIKIVLQTDKRCQPYADAARARTLPRRCLSWLGPNQPGVNRPDPTRSERTAREAVAAVRAAHPDAGSAEAVSLLLDYLLAP